MKKTFAVLCSCIAILLLYSLNPGFQQREQTVLAFTGDILLDRGVGKVISQYEPGFPFEKAKSLLQSADLLFGNLECPITERGTPVHKRSNLIFKSPPSVIPAIKDAGFDILNLGNNHTMDYGRTGLTDTLLHLGTHDIKTVGAGINKKSAHQPTYIKHKGITFGFMGFTAFPAEGYFYLDDKPDTAHIDEKLIAGEICRAKEQCELLIVSFHWGKEFDFYASQSQKNLARLAIENGADAVIGHHPHVLQGLEVYKGKYIFYSIGNFVFDRQIPKGTDETVVLKMFVEGAGITRYEIIPFRIKNCQPVPCSSQDGTYILERLKLYSGDMGKNISIVNGKGYTPPHP